jgi:hypothetical protein
VLDKRLDLGARQQCLRSDHVAGWTSDNTSHVIIVIMRDDDGAGVHQRPLNQFVVVLRVFNIWAGATRRKSALIDTASTMIQTSVNRIWKTENVTWIGSLLPPSRNTD